MHKTRLREKRKLVLGGYVFLKGVQVIAKYHVASEKDGIYTLTLVSPYANPSSTRTRSFLYEGTEYEIGKPMFKRGLGAFPYTDNLESEWKAYCGRFHLRAMFMQMDKIARRIHKIQSPKKVTRMKEAIEQSIKLMRDALKREKHSRVGPS